LTAFKAAISLAFPRTWL